MHNKYISEIKPPKTSSISPATFAFIISAQLLLLPAHPIFCCVLCAGGHEWRRGVEATSIHSRLPHAVGMWSGNKSGPSPSFLPETPKLTHIWSTLYFLTDWS